MAVVDKRSTWGRNVCLVLAELALEAFLSINRTSCYSFCRLASIGLHAQENDSMAMGASIASFLCSRVRQKEAIACLNSVLSGQWCAAGRHHGTEPRRRLQEAAQQRATDRDRSSYRALTHRAVTEPMPTGRCDARYVAAAKIKPEQGFGRSGRPHPPQCARCLFLGIFLIRARR